jgi:DNA-binding transcriptional MerR regulator
MPSVSPLLPALSGPNPQTPVFNTYRPAAGNTSSSQVLGGAVQNLVAPDPGSYPILDDMKKAPPDEPLTAADCAARMGLTVRALRVYERHGLIAPRRTAKNWRLYGIKEIERLNEIVILKGFGLALAQIARLLAGREANLDGVLATQAEALARQRSRIDRSLTIIADARRELSGATVSELTKLSKDMTMTKPAADETSWRRYEQARPRTETKIKPSLLGDYQGHFKLDDDVIVTIEPGGNTIALALTGQDAVILVPEAPDKFFSKDMPLQATFERDAKGTVRSLVIHQNGTVHKAGRTSASEAKAAAKALADKLSAQKPHPRSEAMVRELIAGAQAGRIDTSEMTPRMAHACQDQQDTIIKDIVKSGTLLSLSFKGVGPDGYDVYDAGFENGQQQWRIHFDRHGKTDGLWMRPGP